MGGKKRNASVGGKTVQPDDGTPTLSDNGSTQASSIGTDSAASNGGRVQGSGGKRAKRDRTNPPVYACIGVNATTGAMDVVATFPTIGKMRKEVSRMRQMVGRFYAQLHFARVRYLEMVE